MNTLQTELVQLLGPEAVLTGSACQPHETDWRKRYTGAALAVAMPSDVQQCQALVHWAIRQKVAIVPQGGNTSHCGAATPDASQRQVVVAMHRMHGIRHLNTIDNTITVDAGISLQAVQSAAANANRLFPLSLASEGSCQIGGVLATNAGGVQVLRYGNARDLCLGIEAILPNGELFNGLHRLRKNNTGYDLKQLLIGSEGTLGLITGATLKLFPPVSSTQTALVGISDLQSAAPLLRDLQAELGDAVTAFELMSGPCLKLLATAMPQLRQPFDTPPEWVLLIEISNTGQTEFALEQVLEKYPQFDTLVAASDAQALSFWALRENMSEAQRQMGPNIKHDISLPISQLATFVAEMATELQQAFPSAQPIVFGHIGDGNLHYNVAGTSSRDDPYRHEAAINERVYRKVLALEGSISAEHGIGQLKAEWLTRMKSPAELNCMRAIKQSLDPFALFNPGKIFTI